MDHIIVFTKYPIPGYAKTRLIPRVGEEGAARISRQLAELCLRNVRTFATGSVNQVSVQIYYSGGDASAMKEWLGITESETYHKQTDGDLGTRLKAACKASFDIRAQRVVIVGTDIPELDAEILREAFQTLEDKQVVLGPALDGGYYLIGMTSFQTRLFEDVPWSTADVFQKTLERADEISASIGVLKTLRDVDTPEDLPYVEKFLELIAK